MKPEIITDLTGIHNKDLDKTIQRISSGASWKDQSLVWITPSANTIAAKVVWSWLHLILPPNNKMIRMLALGQEVGDAYSNTIETVIAHPDLSKWKYVLTVEHDNIPEADGLMKLLEQMDKHPELSAIGGLYFTKGHGGVAQIWGDINDPIQNYRPQVPVPNSLIECYGVAMGFTLYRLSMLKDTRLQKPLFKTKASKAEGVGTQDLTFWGEARKYGYRCAIDCSCLVGHYDLENDIIW